MKFALFLAVERRPIEQKTQADTGSGADTNTHARGHIVGIEIGRALPVVSHVTQSVRLQESQDEGRKR